MRAKAAPLSWDMLSRDIQSAVDTDAMMDVDAVDPTVPSDRSTGVEGGASAG